ncbi:penicillin-binding protein 2 [Proteiniclasticum sp. BAD-10]|uniref:Penicillin-binding protein 2 n=1 Tax=Proteiniclasticum sediminis TaxID=2804028 RepID=A0A941CTL1_9CLOT|nr:penicillin-binding transpeptidase domain-containing protein [Proteiniclasticum sediminis]MBR0577339.1 penicillin-binding protein 2 [Proteiniclasticum sediminis]
MREDVRKQALNKNIMILSSVILALFVGIMAYMVYFQVFMAREIAEKPGNARYAEARNEVLRGTIYDRYGVALSSSVREENNSQTRVYAGKEAFAQVLGYVSRSGTTGLESYMDRTLTTDEFVLNLNKETLLGILQNPTKAISRTKLGNQVVTTFDAQFQQKAYGLLGNKLGSSGSIVAMDPQTGEILAMVNRPSYDPNKLEEIYGDLLKATKDDGVLLNKAARGTYFPGSTFKIITLIAALENIGDAATRVYADNGLLDVKVGKDLPNINGNVYGNISLKEAFAVSSNVVFGGLSLELGGDKLAEVAQRFGFNQDLNLDGLSVGKSVFTAYGKSDDGALAASGIGQTGVSTHPLQMAMVASGVANGGKLMVPRVVRSILKYDGTTKETFQPQVLRQVTDEATALLVKEYMKNNVDSSKNSNMKRISALRGAGKTGTAEDFYVTTGETEAGNKEAVTNSWFVGFAPYENPKIAIAVLVMDGGGGSGKAAGIAAELMEWYLGNR